MAKKPTKHSPIAISKYKDMAVFNENTAINPIETAVSISRASIRSAKVGPIITRTIAIPIENKKAASAKCIHSWRMDSDILAERLPDFLLEPVANTGFGCFYIRAVNRMDEQNPFVF